MELHKGSAAALRNPKTIRVICIFALLLLVAAVFGRAAGHEFVNLDDDKFLFNNAYYLPPTFHGLARLWSAPHAHLYTPVTMTVWWFIAQVATLHNDTGATLLNPWIFHAASLAVSLANVLLVWQLLRRVVRSDFAAMLGAAVFAIHPFQVETLAWASEMKDLLAAMFSLLALLALLPIAQSDSATIAGRKGLLITALLCFIAAMLSKPSAVALPIIAAAILWAIGARPRLCASVLAIGLALAVPVMMLARWAQPAITAAPPALWLRPLVAADALAFYLGRLIWPFRFAVDYGQTPAAVCASAAIYWTWIFPAAITIIVFLTRRPLLIASWVIFVAAVTPNLGLVPFDFQAVSTVADHYVYFSMLGVSLAVAYGATIMPRAQIPLLLVIALLSIISFHQVGYWRDSESLWRHAIDINPRSGLAYGNLGVTLLDRGDAAGALPLLQRAAALDPNDAFAPMNLARAQLAVGDTAGAAQSALELERAYRRRADFNADLTAAVLEHFAAEINQRGDAASAAKLRRESARLRSR